MPQACACGSDGLLLGPLGAVLGTALLTPIDAEAVQGAADDVVTDAGKVANAAATDKNDRVFLEVVTFATDVGGHFLAVRQTHAGDLTKRRVGLLGGLRTHEHAHAALLRSGLKVLGLLELDLRTTRIADELVDGRHSVRQSAGREGGKSVFGREHGRSGGLPGLHRNERSGPHRAESRSVVRGGGGCNWAGPRPHTPPETS